MEYGVVKQQLKHLSAEDYETLRELSHAAKNLRNEATYNERQYLFQTDNRLGYYENNKLLKASSANYRILNSNMSQQLIKDTDESFRSFFGLLKAIKEGKTSQKVYLPGYLPKDGFAPLIIGFVRLKDGCFVVPYSNSFAKTHKKIKIPLPPLLKGKKIKEIRIIPVHHARFFEVQYVYEIDCVQRQLDKKKALALDPGIDNQLTGVTSDGEAFIMDGRELKSINQWYNKENSRLQSIYALQGAPENYVSDKQFSLLEKRNAQVDDILSKTAKAVIDFCVDRKIGVLVVGHSKGFQESPNMGKAGNQRFMFIPFGKLRRKLKYLCERNGIEYVEEEESYTSKASFWDKDDIPVYDPDNPQKYVFSGKRAGHAYRTKNGMLINADINGALNILRKSNVVSMDALYSRGYVDTPARVRIVTHKPKRPRHQFASRKYRLSQSIQSAESVAEAHGLH